MRTAVSENRRSVSCFAWIGYRRAEPRAANPGAAAAPAPLLASTGIARLRRLAAERMSIRSVQPLRRRQRAVRPVRFLRPRPDRVFNRSNRGADCCELGRRHRGTPSRCGSSTVVDPGRRHSILSVAERSRVGRRRPGLDRFVDRAEPDRPIDPTAKSKVVPPPRATGHHAPTGPQGASYQTRGQDSGARIARRRTDSTCKTTVTTPEPTSRSAQAAPVGPSGRRRRARPARKHPAARLARRSAQVVRDAAGSAGGPAEPPSPARSRPPRSRTSKTETPAADG